MLDMPGELDAHMLPKATAVVMDAIDLERDADAEQQGKCDDIREIEFTGL
jgi:hypothetical protein